MLQIRRGFDYTYEDVVRNDNLKKMIDTGNLTFIELSPKLRLYSNDKIFNMYSYLSLFSRYSYARGNSARLIENSKWAFDAQITLLAKMMQEDLGYRRFNSGCETIICPECGEEHDIISKCPNCGITYDELQMKSIDILKQNFSNNK